MARAHERIAGALKLGQGQSSCAMGRPPPALPLAVAHQVQERRPPRRKSQPIRSLWSPHWTNRGQRAPCLVMAAKQAEIEATAPSDPPCRPRKTRRPFRTHYLPQRRQVPIETRTGRRPAVTTEGKLRVRVRTLGRAQQPAGAASISLDWQRYGCTNAIPNEVRHPTPLPLPPGTRLQRWRLPHTR